MTKQVHGKTRALRRSKSVEEVCKEREEEVQGENPAVEDPAVEDPAVEDPAVEEEQAETEEGVTDNDDDRSSFTVPDEETQAPERELSPINEGEESKAHTHANYASLNHSIIHLSRQIETLDRTCTSKLDSIHELLLVNYNRLLESNELLNAIHAGLHPGRVGWQTQPGAKRRDSPVTPRAPSSKRVSSRPLGTEHREQYGQ